MIPVRLELQNFLSYREPDPVDLTAFEVACLSGPNGVGKSSLIVDAMTWALFGAARGCEGGQNQDRLIHDGADEMWVDLTFELGGATYRVLRRRTRSGRSELRFTVLTSDGWTNLAADTMRETDARIGRELRMDYRTFVTSTFFLQGHAEDFLRMGAEDRKDVFARLLDLQAYERLEAAAKDRARTAERLRADLAERAERLRTEAEDPGAVSDELERARQTVAQAAADLQGAEADAAEATAALAELQRQEALLERERLALREQAEHLERERVDLGRRREELDELAALLGRQSEVATALEELETARSREAELRRARERAHAIEKEIAALAEQVSAQRRGTQARVEECTARLATLTGELERLGACEGRLRDVDATLRAAEDASQAAAEIRRELEAQREIEARLEEREGSLAARRDEVEEKRRLAGRGKSACPLCGSALDAAHRRELARRLRSEQDAIRAELAEVTGALEVAGKEVRRLREDLARAEATVGEREELLAVRERLRSDLEHLATVGEEAALVRITLSEAQDALASGTYAVEGEAEVRRLQEQLAATYDAEGHRALVARIEELAPFEELHRGLAAAQGRREVLEEEIRASVGRCGLAEVAVGEREQAVAELVRATSGASELRTAGAAAEREVAGCRETLGSANAATVRLEGRLEAARRAAEEAQQAEAAERAAATEHRRYAWLAKAFGRGGIPDRIIENAVPELQDEANDILGRLSDHEMSLHFQMSRDTKSGKVRETFDVLVHHDGGVRDFQMFSGGEAFRIAFAVRLGLSKLLVRRAGARLETLVIDEGFGTQDPQGRERLVQAIELARTEFAKVLVITHLEELRDAFGTQIRVTKDTEEGSVVEVLGEHRPTA